MGVDLLLSQEFARKEEKQTERKKTKKTKQTGIAVRSEINKNWYYSLF